MKNLLSITALSMAVIAFGWGQLSASALGEPVVPNEVTLTSIVPSIYNTDPNTVSIAAPSITNTQPTSGINLTSAATSVNDRANTTPITYIAPINNAPVTASTPYTDTIQYVPPTNVTVSNPGTFLPILPSPSLNISINDTGRAYVQYGGSATINWESYGTNSCAIEPISQSGTNGHYTLTGITSNRTITMSCTTDSSYSGFQIMPGSVDIKVLPPTYEYLKNYLSTMHSTSTKKVNLNHVSSLLNFSQKAYSAGKTDRASVYMQRSINDLTKEASKKGYSFTAVEQFIKAANYLNKSLPVKVVIAPGGCSATATGPAGYVFEYGANFQERIGYGQQATIPTSGSITVPISAAIGWAATGEVSGPDGVLYGRVSAPITAACTN